MAFTNAQFVEKVLETLGRLGTGQAVENEDSEYILDQMEAAFALLSELEICPIPEDDNIDASYFLPLVDYVAVRCGKYGRTTVRGEPLRDIKRAAEADLRALSRQSPAARTLQHEFVGRTGRTTFNWTSGT